MTPPAPSFKVETVDAARAVEYLKANLKNRPLSRKTVRNYANAIRRGEWMMNAEAVKFDWDGNLVDGQHRLEAIKLAQKPIDTLVARGLDPEAFKTIDTGKVRAASDILALRGIRYHHAMATAYRSLHRWLARDKSKERITNTQLLALVKAHPKLIERGYEALQKPLDAGLVAPAMRVFWFYLATSIDSNKARDFLAGIARPNAKQPNAAKLHKRLDQTNREVIRPSLQIKLAWLIDTWNHEVAGRMIEQLPRYYEQLPAWHPKPKVYR